MLLILSDVLLIVMVSCELGPVKVAVSLLVVPEVAPGKVPTPVFQLFSAPPATQFVLVGELLQVADDACTTKMPIDRIVRPTNANAKKKPNLFISAPIIFLIVCLPLKVEVSIYRT